MRRLIIFLITTKIIYPKSQSQDQGVVEEGGKAEYGERRYPPRTEMGYPHGAYPPPYPPPYPPYPPFPGPGYIAGSFGGQQPVQGYQGAASTTGKAFVPFFGYVDPILLIAIVAFPVLGTLGVTSLLMPIIPIVIYIISLIFPSGSKMRIKTQNNLMRNSANASSVSKLISQSKIDDQLLPLFLHIFESALSRYDW